MFVLFLFFTALRTIPHQTLDHVLRCHLTTKVYHRKLQSARMYLRAAGRGPDTLLARRRHLPPFVAPCCSSPGGRYPSRSPHNCLNDHERQTDRGGSKPTRSATRGCSSAGDVLLARNRMQMTNAQPHTCSLKTNHVFFPIKDLSHFFLV